MIYSHITAEGKITPIETEKPLGLEEMQKLVGGWIEFTTVELGTELCINEEGRINGSKPNARYPQVYGDVIVGRQMHGPDGLEFVGLL